MIFFFFSFLKKSYFKGRHVLWVCQSRRVCSRNSAELSWAEGSAVAWSEQAPGSPALAYTQVAIRRNAARDRSSPPMSFRRGSRSVPGLSTNSESRELGEGWRRGLDSELLPQLSSPDFQGERPRGPSSLRGVVAGPGGAHWPGGVRSGLSCRERQGSRPLKLPHPL